MDQYFNVVYCSEQEKATNTSRYLSEDVKLWWKTQLQDDKNVDRLRIEMWEQLKKKLKD